MSKSSKTAQILLLGQPNAGKSTLYNRLVRRREAIVSSTAQTTRDLLRGELELGDSVYELVDSAGLIKDNQPIAQLAQDATRKSIADASLILFVVDGSLAPSPGEHELAKVLHRQKATAIVVANKIDSKAAQANLETWRRLGFDDVIAISALHNTNIEELTDTMMKRLPKSSAELRQKLPTINVAIIGKPNAGKSSMLNSLAGEELALTSDEPNTTRDINYYNLTTKTHTIRFADTAGLSRAGKRKTDIEFFASVRTKKALLNADVGLVLIDSTEYRAAMQKRLAGLVKDTQRALIIVVTKSDLIEDDEQRAQIERSISANFQFAWWAPLVFTSTSKPKSFIPVLQQIEKSFTNYHKELSTRELNKALQDAMAGHPPPADGKSRIHLNYATQTATKPPTITIFGSKASALHFSYLRFLENQFRAAFDLTGTPIKLEFRSKYKEDNEVGRGPRKSGK